MTISKVSSKKPITNLSTSVQKRKTLYMADTDPRAKDPAFAHQYYGEIVVLTEAHYISLIKSGQLVDGIAVQGDLIIDEGTQVTYLPVATNLYWDVNDVDSIRPNYDSASSSWDIKVTFDYPANLSEQELLNYEFVAHATEGVGADPFLTDPSSTNNLTAQKVKPVITFEKVAADTNMNQIKVRWLVDSSVTTYELNIGTRGTDFAVAKGQSTYTYRGITNVNSNGWRYVTVTAAAGKTLSGSYTFTVYANYNGTTSSGKALVIYV